ncbi:MAG: transposase [Bacteroidetes bacterium]|nr:transposase [Bacteroidota bacterium]
MTGIFFYTASIIKKQKNFFSKDRCEIITNSLKYLVDENRIFLYAFVIMPDHIHLIWEMNDGIQYSGNQRNFMKFTAQQLKFHMLENDQDLLTILKVDKKDREYQIWERNPLSIELYTSKVIDQKLDYIHNNPLQKGWNLTDDPANFYYSSAGFYLEGKTNWSFITNIYDV